MLYFVESALTGSGLATVRWALDNDIDAALVTTDTAKYRDVPHADVVPQLAESGRVFVVESTESTRVPDSLVPAGPGPHGVICATDRHLLFAAALAERIGAPFPPLSAVRTFRDKRAARRFYQSLDVPTVRWAEPTDGDGLAAFVSSIGGPAVLKNCRGTGSLDVRLCRTPQEARVAFDELTAAERYLDGELMAEQYVTGPLYSLETLVVDGECRTLGVTDRQLGPQPSFCELSYTFPVEVPARQEARMCEVVETCVKATGITQGMLHTEFVLTEDGPVVVELNARPVGGLVTVMMSDCLDVAPAELLCRAALGRPVPPVNRTGRYSSTVTVYPPAPGRLVALYGTEVAANVPFVTQVLPSAPIGGQVSPARDYRGALCQIRTVATTAGLAFNAALAAAREINAEVAS